MAKRKKKSPRPQRQHKQASESGHDKRQRLDRANPGRRKTAQARVPLTGWMKSAVAELQAVMDSRIAFRLPIIVSGMLLANGRRSASSWFVAAGVKDDWDRFYDGLISIGKTSAKLGQRSSDWL